MLTNTRTVSFKIYDLDRDGYIDKEELFHMLQASLFENFLLELSESQMRKLVDSTFEEVDLNKDGRLSFGKYLALTPHRRPIDTCH
jgi:Ca2+-binding EF-hand superfamily protein